jgi:hypothetical protein
VKKAISDISVVKRGHRFAVEVMTEDCAVYRLKPEYECGAPPPTEREVRRVFALYPEHFEEIKPTTIQSQPQP